MTAVQLGLLPASPRPAGKRSERFRTPLCAASAGNRRDRPQRSSIRLIPTRGIRINSKPKEDR